MKIILLTVLITGSLSFTACTVVETGSDYDWKGTPQGNEDGTVPSYSRNLVRGWPKGRKLGEHDLSRVRQSEQVHAYHVGRLPSDDRRSMSEAHTVYRLEQDARWDQRLPATPMKSVGPIFGINEPSHRPIPYSDVIHTEMMKQERVTLELQLAQDRLETLEADLKDRIVRLQKVTVVNDSSEKEVKALRGEKKELEKELDSVQKKLKETELKLLESRKELMKQKKQALSIEEFNELNSSQQQ